MFGMTKNGKSKGFMNVILGTVGVVIAVILLLNVLLPTSSTAVTAANLTAGSAAATVAGQFPIFIVLGGLIAVVSIYYVLMPKQ